MKNILSTAALSALIFTGVPGFAGNMKIMPPSLGADCPADCQDQIDQLNSSQARQDQAIAANAADIKTNLEEIEKLKNREAYNPWYAKGTLMVTAIGSMDLDKEEYGFKADTDTGYGFGISVGRQFGNLRLDVRCPTEMPKP